MVGRSQACTPHPPAPPSAVKVVERARVDAEDWAALDQEAHAMRLLAPQPAFVQLRDFFRERSRAYLCMELVEGGELFARIAAKDRFSERGEGRTRSGSVRGVSALTPFSPPAAEARAIAKQLAEAVAYAHGKGVVHRDLKVGEGCTHGGKARRRVRTEPGYPQLALWVEAAMLLTHGYTPPPLPPTQPENILLKSADRAETGIKIADLGFAKAVTGLGALMITPCG